MMPDMTTPNPAYAAAQQAARASFGRLVSWLAWQWRDIAAAEDALADALLKALERWPIDGIPSSPDAWLLSVAKRQLLQLARHNKVCSDPAVTVLLEQQYGQDKGASMAIIPDARLNLMFVCAHPAIDEKIRTPLMLQIVLGLQANEIASAMLMSPARLAQRLVRAKQKIKDTGLCFEEPDASDLPARLHDVLEAIYGAFGLSVEAIAGAESRITDLQQEAIFLCSLVCTLMPEVAEAQGLLALMLFRQARRAAQLSPQGDFIPLPGQDMQRWDKAAILRADQLLWMAAGQRQPGPFQLEAAIQSAHCHRLFTGETPWTGIAQLYAQINRYYPTTGSRVAGAVAFAEAGDAAAGLAQLRAIEQSHSNGFQPWWVAYAHCLRMLGQKDQATAALKMALGLTSDVRLRKYLERLLQYFLNGSAASVGCIETDVQLSYRLF
ncbi:RNA polymerase sigma-70 factor (ECF subfamily) [Undibacterium sp. GrIS 1.8]